MPGIADKSFDHDGIPDTRIFTRLDAIQIGNWRDRPVSADAGAGGDHCLNRADPPAYGSNTLFSQWKPWAVDTCNAAHVRPSIASHPTELRPIFRLPSG